METISCLKKLVKSFPIMQYRVYRDASDRLTVGLEVFPVWRYRWEAWRITRRYGLRKRGPYVKGLDERFQEFRKDWQLINIDWDVWSGFTVTAVNQQAEPLVADIGNYLKAKYYGSGE